VRRLGRGQRYYLYGATASAGELVAYYRTLLKQRGTAIFDNPQVYIFEIGNPTRTRCRSRRA
jgi:hypothetical protein